MSRIEGLRWDSWPEPKDVLLLRALLRSDEEQARAAWKDFRSQWDADAPTHDQFRLFGLIADRIDMLDPAEPRAGMFRGLRRRNAVHAMVMLDRLDDLLARFDELGVEAVVLKGPALALSVYEHAGARPYGDLDVLVPYGVHERITDAFVAEGWVATHHDFAGNHGVNFRRNGAEIDLHRLVHSEVVLSGRPEQTMSVLQTEWAPRLLPSGRRIRVLAPTDALLHTLVHGTQRLLPHNLRWAVDADRILATERVDWDRLVTLAKTFRLSPLVHDALLFHSTLTDRPVPGGVLEQLAADRLKWLERKRLDAFHEWPEPGRFVGKASTNISWALWRTRHLTAVGAVRAFPDELARGLGQRSAWSLPVLVLRRLGRVRLRA
ncbi:MAG: hypothetical protein F2873_00705 [Actinobacteria bacterium]|uniref:Unannotated protein n=1 Tax=freshwater metagenome TaxID=449393 RepID=A0A6J6XGR5_9ZZZZ|nr:hypothetical protein [Actinomycetota bacterium]MSX79018.1 hypothetical protein [Actinomycetota bacterium]